MRTPVPLTGADHLEPVQREMVEPLPIRQVCSVLPTVDEPMSTASLAAPVAGCQVVAVKLADRGFDKDQFLGGAL